MDIQTIIKELESKFGKTFDTNKVTEMLKGLDLSKFSMTDIIDKVKSMGFIGDLEGKQKGAIDELKGKAADMLGSFFKK